MWMGHNENLARANAPVVPLGFKVDVFWVVPDKNYQGNAHI